MSSSSSLSQEIWKFFPKIQTLSTSKKKRFFSTYGLANPSAKSFFLSDYIRRIKPQHTLLILEKKSEVMEYQHLFQAFLGEDVKIFTPCISSDEKEQVRDLFLISNILHSAQKHILLLNRDIFGSLFPQSAILEDRTISLSKAEKIDREILIERLGKAGYKSALSREYLSEGEFCQEGESFVVFPLGYKKEVVISLRDNTVESFLYEEKSDEINQLVLLPCGNESLATPLSDMLSEHDLLFVEELSEFSEELHSCVMNSPARVIESSLFPQQEEEAIHFRFLSLLKFYNRADFLNDLREKIATGWKIILSTKRSKEISEIFLENTIPFATKFDPHFSLILVDENDSDFIPPSFQNPEEKILYLTDREVFHMNTIEKRAENNQDMSDFLTSLKPGDFVVHVDHGIGRFLGIVEQEISNVKREYFEIEYSGNDRLFVPISSADKVARFLVEEGKEPRLYGMDGKGWEKAQKKAKEESQKVAKELLDLYAKRERVQGIQCTEDTIRQKQFEEAFKYVPTPGQIAAIRDIKKDMEGERPMDRLVCGDVGFGKTEVAMRAAFKAVENKMQVAVIAPITILVDQHYKNFKERMAGFDIVVEELSRLKTPAQQRDVVRRIKNGEIDIIIGTHRLFSSDVDFNNLGLLVVDEEQRFGVQQKEKIKSLRKNVHILTMTATPIPRTLNLALHNLRDISTITTPPKGRLPIVTEVRKFSDLLIKNSIERELKRGGQVYFLHNRVETIEAMKAKLSELVPEASCVVAHGQMAPQDLEERIEDFKAQKYNVLISSTIVENGIDLANANTMIINYADRFGLSQLYQLRGRIGRSNKQGFAYLLYSSSKLSLDSKKRFRAIVEASELGSGFELSMRDLEIRGAGDVLGVSQHGSVNSVGVNHFLKLLKNTIKEIEMEEKNEKDAEVIEDVQVDIPLNAFIPSIFIPDSKEKILAYQRLAGLEDTSQLTELAEELESEYGNLPLEVKNLIHVLEIKILARRAKVKAVKFQGRSIELHLGKSVTATEIINLLSVQEKWSISGNTLLLPQSEQGVDFVEMLKQALDLLVRKKDKGVISG